MDLKTTKEEKVKKPKKKKNKERERESYCFCCCALIARGVFERKKKEREFERVLSLTKRSHPITAKKSRQIEDKDGDVRRGRGEQFQPVELSREPHETTRDVVAVR